jgi:prolyl oligopeptidase
VTTLPRLPAVLLALALSSAGNPDAQQAEPAAQRVPDPPRTRRDDVKETLHGVELIDPYRWLEDQEAPETRAFIDAQNAYAHSLLDPLPSLGAIRKRLTN